MWSRKKIVINNISGVFRKNFRQKHQFDSRVLEPLSGCSFCLILMTGGMRGRTKRDKRILGDGGFFEEVLKICQERLERRYRYQALGYDFPWIVDRAEELFHLGRDKVTQPGRYPVTVETRSVLCY